MRFAQLRAVLAAAIALAAPAWNAVGQCVGAWQDVFGSIAADDVHALCVFDLDGPGPIKPSLFVGGFGAGGGTNIQGISRFDGTSWYSVGAGGISGEVDALVTFDDDGDGPHPTQLYAGGRFGNVSSPAPRIIAKFNGTSWEGVGDVPNAPVTCFAVFDADGPGPGRAELYAGGVFTQVGALPIAFLARWNGTAWQPLGTGVNGAVQSLSVWDPDGDGPAPAQLYVGGTFTTAGGQPAAKVASWDGTNWHALGSGISGGSSPSVNAITAFDPDGPGPAPEKLYFGGVFTTAGGSPASGIASWNGSTWSPVGSGVTGTVFALMTADADGSGPQAPRLYVAGSLLQAGGQSAHNIAAWDGSSWVQMGDGLLLPQSGPTNGACLALASFDVDGTGPGSALVFAGGIFSSAGGRKARNLATWNGSAWSTLLHGTDADIECMTLFDDDGPGPHSAKLIVAGRFAFAGSVAANRIARWNGTDFEAIAGGPNEAIYTMLVHDDDGDGPIPPALYVGGGFTTMNGLPAPGIARWDGTTWTVPGGGVQGAVMSLCAFDEDGAGPNPPHLYVGGLFNQVGSITANNIARWDGANWSALGVGANGPIYCMAVFDRDGPGPSPPALYVGGKFGGAGSLFPQPANIARWTGTAWTAAIEGGSIASPVVGVQALCVHDDDGPGPILPALYAGGDFGLMFNVPGNFRCIARWNGTTWTPLAEGLQNPFAGAQQASVKSLVSFDEDGPGPQTPSLIVGGNFQTAGNINARGLARWSGGTWINEGDMVVGEVRSMVLLPGPGTGYITDQYPVLVAGGVFESIAGVSSKNIALRTPGQAPVIDANPVGITVAAGAPAVLSVTAHGSSLAFQWKRDGISLSDGGTISGSHTSVLSIASVALGDVGDYSVLVTGTCGTALSAAAHLGLECRPDFNHDGDLNPDDLGDFITCYFDEPPCAGADFNHDADVNPDDLGDFITAFFLGCP